MKKWIKRISVIVVLLVLVVMSGIFGYRKTHSVKKTEGDTIVKENVKVITEETDKQPVSVKEDSIIFNSNPRYKEGDVIVATGILEKWNSFAGIMGPPGKMF